MRDTQDEQLAAIGRYAILAAGITTGFARTNP
jgi:hypothetical protein